MKNQARRDDSPPDKVEKELYVEPKHDVIKPSIKGGGNMGKGAKRLWCKFIFFINLKFYYNFLLETFNCNNT